MRQRDTILIVDDMEINRVILSGLFQDEYHLLEAENGEQALLLLKQYHSNIAIMLLDVVMPVMDGYQAARAIRGSGKKDAEMIPIIAITANAFVEDKRKTMEAGMDAHLSKPLNVQELMDTIRKFCAGKQICQ